MNRVPQAPGTRGSQKWLQVAVNDRPATLNRAVSVELGLPPGTEIDWLSPLHADEYAEYRDQEWLDRVGVTLPNRPLASFWPQRGPQWDGLARTREGGVLLVEAKSHVPEMLSQCAASTPRSIEMPS